MKVTVTASPLPSNFLGTPQQLVEALLDRLEITVDGNSFVIGDVQPDGNQGPWLKNGTQWYVWNEDTSTYAPLDVSASITEQIYIGDVSATTPDPAKYSLWLQLSGSAVKGLYYYAGSTTGWVTKPLELTAQSVTLEKLANQVPGSLISFDETGKAVLVAPGTPGLFLQTSGVSLGWATPPVLHGLPTFVTPVDLATVPSTDAVTWTTISGVQNHGVPVTATAIILGTALDAHGDAYQAFMNMRANASGSAYVLAMIRNPGGGTYNTATYNQGIYPVSLSSGVLSFDYQTDANMDGSKITLLGYIS